VLFLLSPVKSAFPVADQFLEVRRDWSVIPSGIDYFVRPAGVFEAALEVVEYALDDLDFKGLILVSICISKEKNEFLGYESTCKKPAIPQSMTNEALSSTVTYK
jgi:hypothetical protein